jgi:hypothetical protein
VFVDGQVSVIQIVWKTCKILDLTFLRNLQQQGDQMRLLKIAQNVAQAIFVKMNA